MSIRPSPLTSLPVQNETLHIQYMGWLSRRDSGIFQSTRRRFYVLTQDKLLAYESQPEYLRDIVPPMSVSMPTGSVVPHETIAMSTIRNTTYAKNKQDTSSFTINMVSSGTITVTAPSSQEATQWVNGIQKLCTQHIYRHGQLTSRDKQKLVRAGIAPRPGTNATNNTATFKKDMLHHQNPRRRREAPQHGGLQSTSTGERFREVDQLSFSVTASYSRMPPGVDLRSAMSQGSVTTKSKDKYLAVVASEQQQFTAAISNPQQIVTNSQFHTQQQGEEPNWFAVMYVYTAEQATQTDLINYQQRKATHAPNTTNTIDEYGAPITLTNTDKYSGSKPRSATTLPPLPTSNLNPDVTPNSNPLASSPSFLDGNGLSMDFNDEPEPTIAGPKQGNIVAFDSSLHANPAFAHFRTLYPIPPYSATPTGLGLGAYSEGGERKVLFDTTLQTALQREQLSIGRVSGEVCNIDDLYVEYWREVSRTEVRRPVYFTDNDTWLQEACQTHASALFTSLVTTSTSMVSPLGLLTTMSSKCLPVQVSGAQQLVVGPDTKQSVLSNGPVARMLPSEARSRDLLQNLSVMESSQLMINGIAIKPPSVPNTTAASLHLLSEQQQEQNALVRQKLSSQLQRLAATTTRSMYFFDAPANETNLLTTPPQHASSDDITPSSHPTLLYSTNPTQAVSSSQNNNNSTNNNNNNNNNNSANNSFDPSASSSSLIAASGVQISHDMTTPNLFRFRMVDNNMDVLTQFTTLPKELAAAARLHQLQPKTTTNDYFFPTDLSNSPLVSSSCSVYQKNSPYEDHPSYPALPASSATINNVNWQLGPAPLCPYTLFGPHANRFSSLLSIYVPSRTASVQYPHSDAPNPSEGMFAPGGRDDLIDLVNQLTSFLDSRSLRLSKYFNPQAGQAYQQWINIKYAAQQLIKLSRQQDQSATAAATAATATSSGSNTNLNTTVAGGSSTPSNAGATNLSNLSDLTASSVEEDDYIPPPPEDTFTPPPPVLSSDIPSWQKRPLPPSMTRMAPPRLPLPNTPAVEEMHLLNTLPVSRRASRAPSVLITPYVSASMGLRRGHVSTLMQRWEKACQGLPVSSAQLPNSAANTPDAWSAINNETAVGGGASAAGSNVPPLPPNGGDYSSMKSLTRLHLERRIQRLSVAAAAAGPANNTNRQSRSLSNLRRPARVNLQKPVKPSSIGPTSAFAPTGGSTALPPSAPVAPVFQPALPASDDLAPIIETELITGTIDLDELDREIDRMHGLPAPNLLGGAAAPAPTPPAPESSVVGAAAPPPPLVIDEGDELSEESAKDFLPPPPPLIIDDNEDSEDNFKDSLPSPPPLTPRSAAMLELFDTHHSSSSDDDTSSGILGADDSLEASLVTDDSDDDDEGFEEFELYDGWRYGSDPLLDRTLIKVCLHQTGQPDLFQADIKPNNQLAEITCTLGEILRHPGGVLTREAMFSFDRDRQLPGVISIAFQHCARVRIANTGRYLHHSFITRGAEYVPLSVDHGLDQLLQFPTSGLHSGAKTTATALSSSAPPPHSQLLPTTCEEGQLPTDTSQNASHQIQNVDDTLNDDPNAPGTYWRPMRPALSPTPTMHSFNVCGGATMQTQEYDLLCLENLQSSTHTFSIPAQTVRHAKNQRSRELLMYRELSQTLTLEMNQLDQLQQAFKAESKDRKKWEKTYTPSDEVSPQEILETSERLAKERQMVAFLDMMTALGAGKETDGNKWISRAQRIVQRIIDHEFAIASFLPNSPLSTLEPYILSFSLITAHNLYNHASSHLNYTSDSFGPGQACPGSLFSASSSSSISSIEPQTKVSLRNNVLSAHPHRLATILSDKQMLSKRLDWIPKLQQILRTKIQEYERLIQFYTQVEKAFDNYSGQYCGYYFKPSTAKADGLLDFIGTNMHGQNICYIKLPVNRPQHPLYSPPNELVPDLLAPAAQPLLPRYFATRVPPPIFPTAATLSAFQTTLPLLFPNPILSTLPEFVSYKLPFTHSPQLLSAVTQALQTYGLLSSLLSPYQHSESYNPFNAHTRGLLAYVPSTVSMNNAGTNVSLSLGDYGYTPTISGNWRYPTITYANTTTAGALASHIDYESHMGKLLESLGKKMPQIKQMLYSFVNAMKGHHIRQQQLADGSLTYSAANDKKRMQALTSVHLKSGVYSGLSDFKMLQQYQYQQSLQLIDPSSSSSNYNLASPSRTSVMKKRPTTNMASSSGVSGFSSPFANASSKITGAAASQQMTANQVVSVLLMPQLKMNAQFIANVTGTYIKLISGIATSLGDLERILWRLEQRKVPLISQALTALATTFCSALVFHSPSQLVELANCGFLFPLNSYVTASSEELSMLSDFEFSTQALSHVRIRLVCKETTQMLDEDDGIGTQQPIFTKNSLLMMSPQGAGPSAAATAAAAAVGGVNGSVSTAANAGSSTSGPSATHGGSLFHAAKRSTKFSSIMGAELAGGAGGKTTKSDNRGRGNTFFAPSSVELTRSGRSNSGENAQYGTHGRFPSSSTLQNKISQSAAKQYSQRVHEQLKPLFSSLATPSLLYSLLSCYSGDISNLNDPGSASPQIQRSSVDSRTGSTSGAANGGIPSPSFTTLSSPSFHTKSESGSFKQINHQQQQNIVADILPVQKDVQDAYRPIWNSLAYAVRNLLNSQELHSTSRDLRADEWLSAMTVSFSSHNAFDITSMIATANDPCYINSLQDILNINTISGFSNPLAGLGYARLRPKLVPDHIKALLHQRDGLFAGLAAPINAAQHAETSTSTNNPWVSNMTRDAPSTPVAKSVLRTPGDFFMQPSSAAAAAPSSVPSALDVNTPSVTALVPSSPMVSFPPLNTSSIPAFPPSSPPPILGGGSKLPPPLYVDLPPDDRQPTAHNSGLASPPPFSSPTTAVPPAVGSASVMIPPLPSPTTEFTGQAATGTFGASLPPPVSPSPLLTPRAGGFVNFMKSGPAPQNHHNHNNNNNTFRSSYCDDTQFASDEPYTVMTIHIPAELFYALPPELTGVQPLPLSSPLVPDGTSSIAPPPVAPTPAPKSVLIPVVPLLFTQGVNEASIQVSPFLASSAKRQHEYNRRSVEMLLQYAIRYIQALRLKPLFDRILWAHNHIDCSCCSLSDPVERHHAQASPVLTPLHNNNNNHTTPIHQNVTATLVEQLPVDQRKELAKSTGNYWLYSTCGRSDCKRSQMMLRAQQGQFTESNGLSAWMSAAAAVTASDGDIENNITIDSYPLEDPNIASITSMTSIHAANASHLPLMQDDDGLIDWSRIDIEELLNVSTSFNCVGCFNAMAESFSGAKLLNCKHNLHQHITNYPDQSANTANIFSQPIRVTEHGTASPIVNEAGQCPCLCSCHAFDICLCTPESQCLSCSFAQVCATNQAKICYIVQLMQNLQTHLRSPANGSRNLTIHTLAVQLCRTLNGGAMISCKSAKDRTSMATTWEAARQMHALGVPQLQAQHLMETLRAIGVRRSNVLRNTGKINYAFVSIQRALLPQILTPQAALCSGRNVS